MIGYEELEDLGLENVQRLTNIALLELLIQEEVEAILSESARRQDNTAMGAYLRSLLDVGEDSLLVEELSADDFLAEMGLTEEDLAVAAELDALSELDTEPAWRDLDRGSYVEPVYGCGCDMCRKTFGPAVEPEPVYSPEAPFAGILSGLNGLSLSALVVEPAGIARVREVLADEVGMTTLTEDTEFALALLADEDVQWELRNVEGADTIPGIRHAISEFVARRGLIRAELAGAIKDYDRIKGIESIEERQAREEVERIEREIASVDAWYAERLDRLDDQWSAAYDRLERVRL